MTYTLIFLCVLLVIMRELCFKQGASQSRYQWLVGCGITLWIIEILLWARVLQLIPLSIAFPFMSLCYVGIPLCSNWLLCEPIGKKQWYGIGLISFGVTCIGLSGLG